jgi:hypothetical protein
MAIFRGRPMITKGRENNSKLRTQEQKEYQREMILRWTSETSQARHELDFESGVLRVTKRGLGYGRLWRQHKGVPSFVVFVVWLR